MKMDQIQYFLEIAESHSMSDVAKKNFTTQPAVSKSISNLEKELNVVLLNRSNQGVSLTPAGEIAKQYFEQANSWLKELNHSLEVYRTAAPIYSDPIKLIATLEISMNALNHLLSSAYTNNGKNIILDLEPNFHNILEKIQSNLYDLGFFSIPENVLNNPSTTQLFSDYKLDFKVLCYDFLGAIVSNTSNLASQPTLSISEIVNKNLIIYSNTNQPSWQEDLLIKFHPNCNIQKTSNITLIEELVRNQHYVTPILNPSLMKKHKSPLIQNGVVIPIQENIKTLVGVVKRQSHKLSDAENQLIELTQNLLQ